MAGPRYREIAEDLQRRIRGGEWSPETPLPTEVELMESYAASRNTIRDAVRWLAHRGLLSTRSGRGTYVVRKTEPFVVTMSVDAKGGPGDGEGIGLDEVRVCGRQVNDTPRVEIQAATPELAALLRVDVGALVVNRNQRRRIDDKPWSVQTSYYPFDYVQRGASALVHATDLDEGVTRYLERTLGLVQTGYADHIGARLPDDEEARFFRLADNGSVPIIEISRVAFDSDGRPMRVTVTSYPADRNELVYEVGGTVAQPGS